MYDPNNGPDRSRMMRDYERETLTEPVDEWERLENEYIHKIYQNTVDDGFYKEGRT